MANILTFDEASRVVMVDPTDEKLADILPQVDAYIREATGWDWVSDDPVRPEAKSAARLQLALIYDLGVMQPSQIAVLRSGLISSLAQLETIAIGLQAIQNVNKAMYSEDMKVYLESEMLGLNLLNYNRLSHASKYSVIENVLTNRPSQGYTNIEDIQTTLDTAVKVVMP